MTKRRRGRARELKLAERTGPDSERPRAIGPGLVGGRYRPLSDADVERVHQAVLEVLSRIGLADAPAQLIELATARGCHFGDDGRLRFPRAFVEDQIAGATHELVLHGRDPKHDLEIGGQRVHFGTGGAAVMVLDAHSGRYREATLVDLYDLARLVDQLPNVHWFTRCVIATELQDPLELDINTAYACAAGTTKHIGTAITLPENVAPVVALFDAVFGGEGRFRERPFCKLHSSPIVPPLRYGADACAVIAEAVNHGMPINAITAAQAGATAPATLAGTLVQTVAETLGAMFFVNLLAPGHPFIFSNWPFVSDLRTGSFSGGGGEEALLNAASAQMSNFYDLPCGVAAGMTDSKVPDAQAGMEKTLTNTLAGLAGANLVYESAGMLASLLGSSVESFVIDDEMLGFVLRAVRGIEVNDETLSVDAIEQAVTGAGHFLGAGQTLSVMESEFVYPVLGDRLTPSAWEQLGAADVRERAKTHIAAILSSHFPGYIEPAADRRIRERFPIRLAAADLSAGSGRW